MKGQCSYNRFSEGFWREILKINIFETLNLAQNMVFQGSVSHDRNMLSLN